MANCFLPRDLCRHAVSISVCVSVTFVHCVKTNKHIFEIFSCRVAKPFWFFRTKRHGNTPTGTPLNGASNAGGVGLYLTSLNAIDAATGQVLSTRSPVDNGHRPGS